MVPGSPVSPTHPTTRPSNHSGRLTPGRAPSSCRARSSSISTGPCFESTSNAPWCKSPTLARSPLAMMTPSASMTFTLQSMIFMVRSTIDWASELSSSAIAIDPPATGPMPAARSPCSARGDREDPGLHVPRHRRNHHSCRLAQKQPPTPPCIFPTPARRFVRGSKASSGPSCRQALRREGTEATPHGSRPRKSGGIARQSNDLREGSL